MWTVILLMCFGFILRLEVGWDGADYVQVLPLEKRDALRWRPRRLREADVVGAGRWWPPAYPQSQIPHCGARYSVRMPSPYPLFLITNLDSTKASKLFAVQWLACRGGDCAHAPLQTFNEKGHRAGFYLVGFNIEAAVHRIIMLDTQGLSQSSFCTLSTHPSPCFLPSGFSSPACNESFKWAAVQRKACRAFNEKEATDQGFI